MGAKVLGLIVLCSAAICAAGLLVLSSLGYGFPVGTTRFLWIAVGSTGVLAAIGWALVGSFTTLRARRQTR